MIVVHEIPAMGAVFDYTEANHNASTLGSHMFTMCYASKIGRFT